MLKTIGISHLCFDLDGTLVDSGKTIYQAAAASLNKLNIHYRIPEKEFRQMIGMHFIDIFDMLKIRVEDFEEFISVYKSLYFNFINLSVLYPGVNEVFSFLRNNGLKISVLTTKAQDQAERIVHHFKLADKINYVMGRRNGIAHKPSAEPLLKICEALNVHPEETMIIGDTELDIQCGKNAKAKTCAVLYGYRTEEQIEKEKPDFLISGLNELKKILM
jgi:HAD superfamily hydrolase (TIGR01549 family)